LDVDSCRFMRIGMAFGDIGGDGGRELALFSFKMSALLFFKSYMKSSLLLGFSTILYNTGFSTIL